MSSQGFANEASVQCCASWARLSVLHDAARSYLKSFSASFSQTIERRGRRLDELLRMSPNDHVWHTLNVEWVDVIDIGHVVRVLYVVT